MASDEEFGDKQKKAFDFASDVVKQQITLASAILGLLVTVVGIIKSTLEFFGMAFFASASAFFFVSIVMGCWTLMGLTYQLTTTKPTLFASGLRGKATLQAVLFLAGIFATGCFGISVSRAQPSKEEAILTQQKDIAALLPRELQQRAHAQAFAAVLAQWNSGSLKLPSSNELRSAMVQRLKAAVAKRAMGYETEEWATRRLADFDKLPPSITPERRFDGAALRAVLWAFAINLPVVEKRYSPEMLFKENPLPFFLLFADAQQAAGPAAITAVHVVNAAFKWWTNDWPFCAPEQQ